ncbi:tetratricopeptide repeat protein [Alistipes sp.]|uniref:tetratricopeptide repeat protein n=1 Tax=Alistipes sp. TaxID=1872444 RepID=UPI0025BE6755|nr:tetratricopeptide repeat protein [Alistipes sp.]MCI7140438.1 tetratricopeptide repeat protein [Alistipes sp.]MDY5397361.1 tetratricopeptide repeat protein [Alistipes sp.]
MKRLTAITLLCTLFTTAFTAGKGRGVVPEYPDSLRSVWFYTEGIKQQTIHRDTARARELLREAVRRDSTYAPAYYELAANGMYRTPAEAVELAGRACRLDSTNKWYRQLYGQTLIYAGRYAEALRLFRRLQTDYPKEPDYYRLVAALYEQTDFPVQAILTLDSAELRLGRIPYLTEMKRRLLVSTGQTARAIEEARADVEATPYEARPHAVLATLYASNKQDSLARAEFDAALAIDSTNVETLMMLADFHTERQDYRALLATTRRLFLSDDMPLETKIRRFEQFTADVRFYREYYLQLHDLAAILAIRYPDDPRVVELYADHLIASGELEQALTLYKIHLADRPAVEKYYSMTIDIESYLQRPDSVQKYVSEALRLFPDRVDFHLARGHVMSYAKQYDRAIEAYEESLPLATTDSLRSVIWGMIGDDWHQKAIGGSEDWDERMDLGLVKLDATFRKNIKRSYAAYERSLRYNPDNVLVLNNYAYFLTIEGRDLERALTLASRATALENDNPTYLDTHAWVLFKLGRLDEARKMLQRAVALDAQNSPALLVHYGDVLQALGEHFMAEVYWKRALEKGYAQEFVEPRLKRAREAREAARKTPNTQN